MTGVRLNKAELIERFGISSLMVMRVGALLAQRVDMTEAVLELAGPGSATEKMLRRPEVLSQAQTLDTALIASLASRAARAAAIGIGTRMTSSRLVLRKPVI